MSEIDLYGSCQLGARANGRDPFSTPPLALARRGAELRITLARPEPRNAYSVALRDALVEALELGARDDSIARVVLDAEGPAFCAGGDLDEFGTSPDPATAHAVRTTCTAARLVTSLAEQVEVRIQGACVGAGIELSAFAGRVAARDDAWFALPELAMGLILGAGGNDQPPAPDRSPADRLAGADGRPRRRQDGPLLGPAEHPSLIGKRGTVLEFTRSSRLGPPPISRCSACSRSLDLTRFCLTPSKGARSVGAAPQRTRAWRKAAMRHIVSASLLVGSLVMPGMALFGPADCLAQDFTCAVSDRAADPTLSPGLGFDGEAYQDIVRTAIDRAGGSFEFSMEVAAAIPDEPRLKTPKGLVLWMWGMNTGPGVPQGFPLAPGVAGLLDFWIHLAWDGTSFQAVVIDRRPALQGGEPLVTPVPFEIDGTTVRVVAESNLLDDPQQFNWGSSTWIWPTHLGTTGPHVVDRAPNGAASSCPAN